MKELSVVVVDDSGLIRDLLKCALAKIEGCRLIGMAADGVEGITMIHALQPHVVILDISMPGKNGIELLREVRQENAEIMIIMFTSYPAVIYKNVCLEAGANHYLDKTQIRDLVDICRMQIEELTPKSGRQFLEEESSWKTRFRNN